MWNKWTSKKDEKERFKNSLRLFTLESLERLNDDLFSQILPDFIKTYFLINLVTKKSLQESNIDEKNESF